MAQVHDRIIEFAITLNAAADSLTATAVNYYRDRGYFQASTPYALKFVQTAAVTTGTELIMGESELPLPTHFRFTFSAF